MNDTVLFNLGSVSFQLKEKNHFNWLKSIGEVFCVFDEQGLGIYFWY